MADSKPFQALVPNSSDILLDINCEPCNDVDGHILQAVGFCHECADYLCIGCFSAHRKNKQTRNHKLDDKVNMPKTKPAIQPTGSITEKCYHHPDETIQSFCRSCDQLSCKICNAINHSGCTVKKLSTVATNIKDSQELKDLNDKFSILEDGLTNNLNMVKQNVSVIKKNHDLTSIEIKTFYDELKKLFTETKMQTERIKNDDLRKAESISKKCGILQEQVKKTIFDLKSSESQSHCNENLFISMKKAESQLSALEKQLDNINEDNTVCRYKFQPDQKLKAVLYDLNDLGKLSIEAETTIFKTAVHTLDIKTNSTIINGSVMLPNQYLLLTEDGQNGKVTLVDTKRNALVSELQLKCPLWDVTKVHSDEVAITCCSDKMIQFVSVSHNSLFKGRAFPVNGKCHGIAYNEKDQTLIVVLVLYFLPKAQEIFNTTGKIEILNMKGKVLRCIDNNKAGDPLFKSPKYVALNPDRTMMYVSDYGKNSVTLITLGGEVKAIYKDDSLRGPGGLCLGKAGTVFVQGHKTVHKIEPGSDKLEILLKETRGPIFSRCVTYCHVDDKLYVGQHNNIVKVFQLKQEKCYAKHQFDFDDFSF